MSARRVLIVRVGAMGDVLHALPAVSALRAARPDAEIGWAVDARWAPLLVDESGRGPVVARVHVAETRMWTRAPFSFAAARSVLTLRQGLREMGYDEAVDMQGTLRSGVIGRFACGRGVVGYEDPREGAARLLYGRRLARHGVHVVQQGAALLGEALGVALEPGAVQLPRARAAEEWVEREIVNAVAGGRIAVLAPTAGWGAKQWPVERFAALAQQLRRRGYRVVVNAASQSDAICARVVEQSSGAGTLIACGLAELIALMRRASLVVGNDSGPAHLAAALGRPLVALFGPTDPARNGPWGTGRMRVLREASSVTSHKRVQEVEPGLARMGVEDVMAAVDELGA